MSVAVTGAGVVSALGVGLDEFWFRLASGQSGLRTLSRLDPTGLRNPLAGEVPEGEWRVHSRSGEQRVAGYARVAATEALSRSKIDLSSLRVALVYATNFGSQGRLWDEPPGPSRLAGADFGSLADDLADELGLEAALTVVLSNACSSGTHAIGHAADLIRSDLADAAVVVAADELGYYCLSGLSILHTVTSDTLRPFDVNRSGTLFGEGAAAVVLESLHCAANREASPLGFVLGYGVNNNAYHLTAPDTGGEGMVLAIRRALEQAGRAPEAINHVNAHATGTEHHDKAEAAALRSVFGDRVSSLPVSAIKAATGHTMGAAGAMEAVACLLTLRDGLAPPTVGLTQLDPECDLDVVRDEARPISAKCVLSVSAGLGGNNAALVLGGL